MPVGPHDGPRPDDEPRPDGARTGDAAAAGPDDGSAVGPPDPAAPDAGDADDADAPGRVEPSEPWPPVDGADPAARRPGDDGVEVDVDAEWRRIVERLGDLDRSSGSAADVDGDDRDRDGDGDGDGDGDEGEPLSPAARRVVRPGASGSDPRAWAPDPAVEEAEDHFVPPDPGPVLGGDPLLTMAWCAVLGVPTVVVLSVVVGARLPSIVLQVGAGVLLAGLGVLLWRMPRGGDGEDVDRGPGAVV